MLLAFSVFFVAGCVSNPFITLPKETPPTGVCYKIPSLGYPYWYECQGKKSTQTIQNSLSAILNFTVFPEEQRVFWELADAKGKNFYSNNFSGNSMTILNLRPDNSGNERIEYFSAGRTSFMDILQQEKRLVYRLVKRNPLEQAVSERIFSNSLYGDSSKELTQESRPLQKTSCLSLDGNNLFWFLSKKDSNGSETKALYYNSISGKGISLASQVAKPCNPKQPSRRSSEIQSLDRECSDESFLAKGNFAFWIFRDIWNSKECSADGVTEAVFATFIPEGRVKVLTQFAELEDGDYLQVSKENIDLEGNRFVWVYYSKGLGAGLYYNCLKGMGEPRLIDNSLGNTPESSTVKIEKNTVYWQSNDRQFSAKLQECPN